MVKTTADEEIENLQKRTNQLSTGDEIDGDDEEDEEQTAPPALMRKIVALKQLQDKCKEIDVEYKRERIALEAKYRELKKPIYANQGQIISGAVDVPAETDGPDATSEEVEEDQKGIPGYWAQALLSHPAIREIVTEEDVPALEALSDVQCEYNEDYTSFKLTFYFEENEFFENETLSKTYTVAPDLLDEKSPTLVEHQTSEVNWKEGKNLCVAEVKKKQKAKAGKNKGQVRTVTTLEPKQSFFQYFSEPMDEEEEDDEDEDEEKPRIKLTVEEDYDIGHAIRTAIIPESVLWFTGEAIDDEDYENMGDDEDDDEDEEGDEDDGRVVAKPGNGFATSTGAPGGSQEQPECKQN